MDSSESPTHGQQEGSAWNGHFGCTWYHPLFVFNQYGDLERCLLRAGNDHSAENWRLVLEPVIARDREQDVDLLPRRRGYRQAGDLRVSGGRGHPVRDPALPANPVLQRRIEHLLPRPMGRPPKKPIATFASFRYQGKGWTRPRRVVAKVAWHQGEFYRRVGFILTGDLELTDLQELAPVIVRVRLKGYDHFVIYRGMRDGRVLLADPAWGNRTMRTERFEAAWLDWPEFSRVEFVVEGSDGIAPMGQVAARPCSGSAGASSGAAWP